MRMGQSTMHRHGGHPLVVTARSGVFRGDCGIEHVGCEYGHELLANDFGALRDVALAFIFKEMAKQLETITVPINDDL